MTNPFNKYLKGESLLQYQVGYYLTLQYPKSLWCHIPNEGKRSPFERFMATKMGIKRGVPDLLIFNQSGNFRGLAIELKHGKNKVTQYQKDWLDKLKSCGWSTHICYDLDEAKNIIDNYLSKRLLLNDKTILSIANGIRK